MKKLIISAALLFLSSCQDNTANDIKIDFSSEQAKNASFIEIKNALGPEEYKIFETALQQISHKIAMDKIKNGPDKEQNPKQAAAQTFKALQEKLDGMTVAEVIKEGSEIGLTKEQQLQAAHKAIEAREKEEGAPRNLSADLAEARRKAQIRIDAQEKLEQQQAAEAKK